MRRFSPIDSFVIWVAIEATAMGAAASIMSVLIHLTSTMQIGQSIGAATVLLSVAVAIVIQLWLKLNDLSALASLTPEERRRLWEQVRYRVRALVWLVIFFISFIFYVLAAATLASSAIECSDSLLIGAGAGFGACLILIAGVLVDLNEVATFRWTVEGTDIAAKRAKELVSELRKNEPGFESDKNIQGYKRVSGT